MNIRRAKLDDIEQIAKILLQVSKLHSDNRPDIFKEKKVSELAKQYEEILCNNEKIIIVAENGKKICGVMICKTRIIEKSNNLKDCITLNVDEICVDEDCRSKGIGAMLIDEAKRLAKENNCCRLELNYWEFNKDAMRFYINQGFEVQRTFLEINI